MTTTQAKARFRGKNFEYRVAKLIKGEVVGRSKAIKVGEKYIEVDCQHPPDVVSSWLAVECKYYSELPVWLIEVMTQAEANAPKGLIPVAWVAARRGPKYVIIREQDWLDLHHGERK